MPRLQILQYLEQRSLHYRRLDGFHGPDFFNMEARQTGQYKPGVDACDEWCLELTIAVNFWANPAQLSDAKAIAEKALVHRLYADVIARLTDLELAISNGDRESCRFIVNQIRDSLLS